MAYEMARKGATRGMVTQELHASLSNRDDVIDLVNTAFSAVAGRRRTIRIGQAVIGLSLHSAHRC